MAQVYTKTGDDGTTGLFYGGRLRKDDPRVEAYGTVDEAVAALGAARAEAVAEAGAEAERGTASGPETGAETGAVAGLAALLARLQRDLFVVGAELATDPDNRHKLQDGRTRVTAAMVDSLEPLIDRELEARPLENRFVLPGGSRLGAALDLARVTVRRAERRTLAALDGEPGHVVRYLNRLSDLLFVLARSAEGEPEYL